MFVLNFSNIFFWKNNIIVLKSTIGRIHFYYSVIYLDNVIIVQKQMFNLQSNFPTLWITSFFLFSQATGNKFSAISFNNKNCWYYHFKNFVVILRNTPETLLTLLKLQNNETIDAKAIFFRSKNTHTWNESLGIEWWDVWRLQFHWNLR